ncbi:MAG: hypothetical protein GC206_07160 [Alphaproteobacteria bacterium]|nr:hypothetical protein [Alphaproteobacteria bacterium]
MNDGPRSDVDVAKAAVCEEVADFYTPAARLALGRAAGGFLYPQFLTPLELLHSGDRQRQMANAGTNAMQAVQKTASWQVRGMSVPVSERIRRLWELTDAVQKETAARLEAEPPAAVTLSTLPDLLARRPGEAEPDRSFRIFASLAATLADLKGWAAKFAALAELGTGLAGLDTFSYFDALISEMLRPPTGLDAVLGREETIGDDILRLLALVDGTARPEAAPATPATARPLFSLLASAAMPETRAVLTEHAIQLARSNEKFTRRPLAEEIAFVVDLRGRMTRDGTLLGGKETQEALDRRMARALSDQTIDMLMAGTESVGERVLRAVQLHGRIFGEDALRYLETYVAELMGQPKLERTIVPEGQSPRQRIKLLGKLHAALAKSNIAIKTKERLANQVERFQGDQLDQTGLLEKIGGGKGSTAERLLKIVDLCREGAFIEGANADRARTVARELMKRPDFLESYLAGADQKGERAARLKELQKLLVEARIV